MTHYNVDLTIETTKELEKSEIEDRIREAAETDDKINKAVLAQRIDEVKQ